MAGGWGCRSDRGSLACLAPFRAPRLGVRSLGARSMLDARSFMISTLRSQVGFAAAVAHARLRLSRLELIGGSGRTASRYASAARAFLSPSLRICSGCDENSSTSKYVGAISEVFFT